MLDAAFSNTLVYERRGSVEELKADLVELVAFDRRVNQEAALWGRLAAGCGAGLAIAAALGFCIGLTGIAWTIVAVVVVPLVVTLYMYVAKSALVLDARRYQLAIALVRHLGRDVVPDRPAELRLDFRKTQSPPFERKREKIGALTFVHYKQPWLSLKGKLFDGTKFRIEIEQRVDRKETSKRKTTKIRETFQERVVVTLAGRADKRPSIQHAPHLAARLLARRVKLRSSRLEGGAWRTTVVTDKQRREALRGNTVNADAEKKLVGQDDLLRLFVACYRVWRLVRKPLPA